MSKRNNSSPISTILMNWRVICVYSLHSAEQMSCVVPAVTDFA